MAAGWLSSLPPAEPEEGDNDTGHGAATATEEGGAAASWLTSLAGIGVGGAEADVKDGGEESLDKPLIRKAATEEKECEAGISWLVDLGYSADEAKAALEEAKGDEDEALHILQQKGRSKAADGEPAAKKRRLEGEDILEIEGFQCSIRGRRLVLRPPAIPGLDGPVVGRVQRDGAVAFAGVDEWAREVYESTAFEPAGAATQKSSAELVPGGARRDGFDAAAATVACQQGEPWIWQDFATAEEIRAAHAEMENLNADGRLTAAAATTTAEVKARSDKVTYLDIYGDRSGGEAPPCPPSCKRLFMRMIAAAGQLRWPSGEGVGKMLVPHLGMASIYDAGGAHYKAHRDNERLANGGWVNYRVLTFIAYINPTGFQDASDGGQLRCHLGARPSDLVGDSSKGQLDVAPRGGTAVLFPAREVLHEVLPAHARRYALTLWFPGMLADT
eukprot:TRINITY_DN123179_c0_g1_i1.p1 TRINITY_DN123179_c0_g1~~TRINITY_DN123179_c0_g1_i1.p1  ORF type:complete len:476 (-),score=105.97 TRINITY_DN123179_c0_g1_i1:342-1676(-)